MWSVETPLGHHKCSRNIHIQCHWKLQTISFGEDCGKVLAIWTVHGNTMLVPLCDQDVTIGIHTYTAWATQSFDFKQHFATLAENLQKD